jgi:putative ABC transport system substrate-binding protein
MPFPEELGQTMRRREFITLLGSTVVGLPVGALAQQTAMPVVGFINARREAEYVPFATAFRTGLGEAGFNEGQNVHVEYRWADGQPDRLAGLAVELLRLHVTVVAVTGGALPMVRDALATTPTVSTFGGDPSKLGFVASIARPGGNLTGVSVFTPDLEAKRLELLHELVPHDAKIAVLFDPTFSDAKSQLETIDATAAALGRQIQVFNVSNVGEIDKAFGTLDAQRFPAVAVVGNPLFLEQRVHLLELIARLRIPAIFENREFTAAGGLMSYGTNVADVYRQIGVYTGRILKGERPADLPIVLPTKFDISVNLKTAKSLGINMPTSILLRADEVIQ